MRFRAAAVCLVSCVLVVACKPKHEGDVPLHVSNAPACAAGHTLAKQVVIRIENGSDYAQFPLDTKMSAANTWAGRKATVKVAICERGPCPHPSFAYSHETTVGGDDSGLALELPKFEVACDDGSVAKN